MLDDTSFLSQKDPKNRVQAVLDEFKEEYPLLYERYGSSWAHDVPIASNLAKQIATESMGRCYVFVATPEVYEAALQWQSLLAATARNLAFCQVIDIDNAELHAAWSSHPVDKPFSVVAISSSKASQSYRDSYQETIKKLSGKWPEPIEVYVESDDPVAHITRLGQASSLYAAMLNQVSLSERGRSQK